MKSKSKNRLSLISLLALLTLGLAFGVVTAPAGMDFVPTTQAQSAATPSPSPANATAALATFGRWIMENRMPVECGISEIFGTVTSIKEVRNETPFRVRLWKIDGSTQTLDVAPNSTVGGDFWLPWADNNDQYRQHHMTLSLDDRVIANIWQSGPHVRFAAADAGFLDGGPPIPGISKSGGDRALVITLVDGRRDQPAFMLIRRDCPRFR